MILDGDNKLSLILIDRVKRILTTYVSDSGEEIENGSKLFKVIDISGSIFSFNLKNESYIVKSEVEFDKNDPKSMLMITFNINSYLRSLESPLVEGKLDFNSIYSIITDGLTQESIVNMLDKVKISKFDINDIDFYLIYDIDKLNGEGYIRSV